MSGPTLAGELEVRENAALKIKNARLRAETDKAAARIRDLEAALARLTAALASARTWIPDFLGDDEEVAYGCPRKAIDEALAGANLAPWRALVEAVEDLLRYQEEGAPIYEDWERYFVALELAANACGLGMK